MTASAAEAASTIRDQHEAGDVQHTPLNTGCMLALPIGELRSFSFGFGAHVQNVTLQLLVALRTRRTTVANSARAAI